jgi:alpha-beta hydrolase superfamily lysophospholipase
MTQHMESGFQTTDGLHIHTESWLPDGDVRAMVVIVHGIGEHIGRYRQVAAYLNQQGYAVYGLDHRTHGKSDGQPRVYITDFDQVVADLKQFLDMIAQPSNKVFLYGHSMGSFVSLNYVLKYQQELAGFISSGCPIMIDSQFPTLVAQIGNLLNVFMPTLPLIPLELDGVSRDPAVVAAYRADPLVHAARVRVRMAVGYNNALKPLRQRLPELRLPMLILHGGADKIAPVAGSQFLYEKASSPDKTLKIYPGLYHEIHNEPEQNLVLSDITSWLNTHLS